jgi:hypothetical protein
MKFHSICVMRQDGTPIYYHHFSEMLQGVELTLLSSFFGAIIQFSTNLVKKPLNVLEVGDLRFVFWRNKELIFIVIAENTISFIMIEDRLRHIAKELFSLVDVEKCQTMQYLIENPELDKKLEIILDFKESDTNYVEAIKKIFEAEQKKGDVLGVSLFSLKGELAYSSFDINDLHTIVKEIEIRMQSDTGFIKGSSKFISQIGIKLFVSQIILAKSNNNLYYLTLLFDSNISIGMADLIAEDLVKAVSEKM